jgi:hypothetical protein
MTSTYSQSRKALGSFLPALTLLLIACSPNLKAGQSTESPNQISANPTNSDSLSFGDWINETVLHPSHPYEIIPGKSPEGWAFILEPYGWLPGVYGQIGAKGLPPVNVHQSPIQVLSKLNWAAFLRGEMRNGRWGLIGDGFYAKFSAPGNLNGPLYDSATATLNQSIDSLSLAFRAIDDQRYFVDFYAGARYYYYGVQVSATPLQISKFQNPRANAAATALLPTYAATDTSWVDPIVGLRARVNLTRFLYLEALGDVGGFDAGSQIAWNTQATVGVRLTRNIDFEAGYRYMYIDYVKGSLDCNLNFAGALAGIVFKF